MSKSRLKWPLRIGLTLVLLYVAVCLFMTWGQEKFLFHPEVVAHDHQWNLPPGAQEIWLTAEDGAKVNGVFHAADSAQGAVLFLHGNGGNLESPFRYRDLFHEHGYHFLVIDYRTYGKSQGPMSEQGLIFDAEAAYEYLKSKVPENQIYIYGQSLGSGIATRIAAKYKPRMLFLEAPYTSIVEVAQGDYPFLPVSWLLNYPLRSRDYISQVQCEVIIFHGTEDDVIPYEMGVEMSQLANKAQLITVEGGDHMACFKSGPYQQKMFSLLRRRP